MTPDATTLASRAERADGASRELDAEIALAIGLESHGPSGGATWWKWADGQWHIGCPQFTASLDAALTLVPEGWVWIAGIDYDQPGLARLHWAGITSSDRPQSVNVSAATPALALCAAAIRTRAREGE